MNPSEPRLSSSSSHQPPEHLSEFFSFMNNKSNGSISPIKRGEERVGGSSGNGGDPGGVVRKTSLNTIDTFTSFSPSVLDLPNILTTRDFENTVSSYSKVITKAQRLQLALDEVTKATNEFGQALEDSINENPKVNNLKTVSDGLNNAGGLQFMISTNQQILGRLLKQNFEIPLQAELNKLQSSYQENHQFYQQEIRLRSRILRDKELKNLKLSKLKTRNLSEYKNNLVELTRQVEEIDRLKYGYYHEINLMLERFNQDHLLTRTGSLVRAQLEIYEGIAKKGWSGGGLDELLAVSPDLFAHNEDEYSKENQADGGEFDNEDTLDFINRLDNVETEGIEGLDDEDEDDEVVVSGAFDLNKNEVLEDETVLWRGGDERVKIPLIGGRSTPIQSQQTEELNDISVDESFSLPMVSNSNSLLGKGKDKQEEGGELEGTHAGEGEKGDADTINKDNLLSDL